jgi:hypothetical protein
MNISSLASVNATSASGVGAGAQQDFRTRMQQSMAPVATLFGMTTDKLMSAVKSSGMSLADYAASKGITNDNLTAAVKQGLHASAANGVQLSDTQLTNLAQRIENHKPGEFPQGPSPVTATNAAATTSTTSTIKADLDKLIADLKTLDSTGSAASSSAAGSNTTSSDPTSVLLDALVRFDRRA